MCEFTVKVYYIHSCIKALFKMYQKLTKSGQDTCLLLVNAAMTIYINNIVIMQIVNPGKPLLRTASWQ